MPGKLITLVKRAVLSIVLLVLAGLAVYTWDSQRGPPLQPWHTYVPQELSARQIDAGNWEGYLQHEAQLFKEVQARMTTEMEASSKVAINRYFDGSPLNAGHFTHDWNHSYTLQPAGRPRGAVVMLHGLTDAPYSLRHVGERYRAQGYVVIGVRLPGHGTVPGALTQVQWQEWMAATRLAVREARRRAGNDVPLHIVGYSNGGALAMKYALDAIEDPQLARPDRLVLISPMIGLTRFARFAGVAGWPAIFPAFAKSAWLDIVPEYNPFKYNSFPVNAARESFLLTDVLHAQLTRLNQEKRLDTLAPVLAFQSVIDSTVSTPSVVHALFGELPANGSELVLFDVNRSIAFSPLLRPSAYTELQRVLPAGPQRYRTTIIGNVGAGDEAVVARTTEAGQTVAHATALGVAYPTEIFSLSHIALPFPTDDALYGLTPGTHNDFGIQLGAVAPRGERGALVLDLNNIYRISSNPFMPYLLDKVEATITPAAGVAAPILPTGAVRPAAAAESKREAPFTDAAEDTAQQQEIP